MSLPWRVVQGVVVEPVCSVSSSVAAAAARGARWATAGGFPLLPALCDALRVPPPLARSYQAGLAAFHAAHGGSTALLALLVACVLIPLGRAAGTPLFAAVGRRALRRAAPGGDGPVGAAALRKWCEASWKLVAYTTLTAFGLAVTAGQPWAADTTLLWAGWPEAHDHPPPLRAFYAAQVGHYLYSAVDLCCWETRRKDFAAMLAHHGATLALLLVSFAFSFLRVGALIEVLHDACDVWMEGAKLCKYAGFNAWSTAIFVVFLLSWVALRMLLLPLVVIRSTSVETAVWATFNGLLLFIQALHFYWFYFIACIAVAAVTSVVRDVRSDDEDDGDEPAAKKRD